MVQTYSGKLMGVPDVQMVPLMTCVSRLGTPTFADATSAAHLRWIGSDLSAQDLLIELDGLAGSLLSARREQWLAFRQSLQACANLLTPLELARTMSIADIVRQCDYWERHNWIQRCRMPPDTVIEPKSSASDSAAQHAAEIEAMRLELAHVEAKVARGELQLQQQQLLQMRLEQRMQWRLLQQEQYQQQMLSPQQDPWAQAFHEELTTPAPRPFLAVNAMRRLTNEVASLGIDLASETALTLDARDANHAVQLACLLSHARGCDLFRGQPLPWKPIPSYLRLPIDERLGSERWRRYRDWAQTEPSLADAQETKQLAAIAQHYGLPTHLLDFSYNPRVAAHFATHCGPDVPPGQAIIYCLRSAGLKAAHHFAPAYMRYYDLTPQVQEVHVDGLLRMQAQEGSFVFVNQEDWTNFYALDAIRFPRGHAVPAPTALDIYPDDRSRIELAVERYFAAK